MGNQPRDDSLIQIEESQAELVKSIARAKALAEESERRVQRHRADVQVPAAENRPEKS